MSWTPGPEVEELALRHGRVRGGPEGYDGVAELWWESFEDMTASASDPKAAEAGRMLLEDEKRFIDLPKSPLFWGVEHVVIG